MRAFYVECSGSHWLGIGRRMAQAAGVAPVLWTGDAATVAAARATIPGIVGVVGVDAACGRLPPEACWSGSPIDASLIRSLAADESIALTMMDRMDPAAGVFDHDARRRHWHDLLLTWNAALDALRPDVVIFAMSPHKIYDFALYALCKQRNIQTRMFERATPPGLVFVVARFEDGSPELLSALERPDMPMPSEVAIAHIRKLRAGGEAALPENYRKKLAARRLLRSAGRQAAAGLLQTLRFEATRAAYLLLRRRASPPNYLVTEDAQGRLVSPGPLRWLVWRWRGQLKKWQLARILHRLARPIDQSKPYVLLALHYQPERAVVPMAGVLGDQTLIVDMLSHCLPPGWTLVVKEHPWQLVPFARGEQARSAAFYRRISAHPNVALAPPDADTDRLLARARAAATATGSIGWQAIARGIPALLFGAAWYRDAPGTYRINDLTSCRHALAAVESGVPVPADAAERTLAALEAVAVAGYLEPELEAVGHVEEEEAIASMSDALARSLAIRFAAGSLAS